MVFGRMCRICWSCEHRKVLLTFTAMIVSCAAAAPTTSDPVSAGAHQRCHSSLHGTSTSQCSHCMGRLASGCTSQRWNGWLLRVQTPLHSPWQALWTLVPPPESPLKRVGERHGRFPKGEYEAVGPVCVFRKGESMVYRYSDSKHLVVLCKGHCSARAVQSLWSVTCVGHDAPHYILSANFYCTYITQCHGIGVASGRLLCCMSHAAWDQNVKSLHIKLVLANQLQAYVCSHNPSNNSTTEYIAWGTNKKHLMWLLWHNLN